MDRPLERTTETHVPHVFPGEPSLLYLRGLFYDGATILSAQAGPFEAYFMAQFGSIWLAKLSEWLPIGPLAKALFYAGAADRRAHCMADLDLPPQSPRTRAAGQLSS